MSFISWYSPSVLAVKTSSPLPDPTVPNHSLPLFPFLSTLICQAGWINVNVFYEMLTRCKSCSSWLNIDRGASCFGGFLNISISPEPCTCAETQQSRYVCNEISRNNIILPTLSLTKHSVWSLIYLSIDSSNQQKLTFFVAASYI